jgi:uncharacterized OsmC-like protein
MALTMAAVAAHKGFAPERLDVRVEWETREDGREWASEFRTTIDLGAGMDDRARKILFNAARNCEVHRLLRGRMAFEETLL